MGMTCISIVIAGLNQLTICGAVRWQMCGMRCGSRSELYSSAVRGAVAVFRKSRVAVRCGPDFQTAQGTDSNINEISGLTRLPTQMFQILVESYTEKLRLGYRFQLNFGAL